MNNNILYNLNKEIPSTDTHKYPKIVFVVLFGVILLTSGFGILTTFGGTTTLGGCIFLTLILSFYYTNIKISTNSLLLALLLIASIFTTTLFHDDEIKSFIIFTIFIVIAFIISQTLRDDFNIIYVKLFYFLSIFSLVMWIINLIFPAIIYSLPILTNENGHIAYTALFSTISSFGNVEITRNQGIFWEPGAYQTFINIAVTIVMFTNHFKEKKLKYIIVFAITVFTTFSTTGYIVFCGLVLTYCLNEQLTSKSTSRSLKYTSILLFIVVVFLAVYSMLPTDIQIQLFGKLTHYFNDNTNRVSSTSVRVDAFLNGINAFLEYPLLGCGVTKLDTGGAYTDVIMTCTPVNYFAFYGLPVGTICLWGLFLYAKSLAQKNVLGIAIFICLLLSIISEDYIRHPIILTLIFLGTSKQTKTNNTTTKKAINL